MCAGKKTPCGGHGRFLCPRGLHLTSLLLDIHCDDRVNPDDSAWLLEGLERARLRGPRSPQEGTQAEVSPHPGRVSSSLWEIIAHGTPRLLGCEKASGAQAHQDAGSRADKIRLRPCG